MLTVNGARSKALGAVRARSALDLRPCGNYAPALASPKNHSESTWVMPRRLMVRLRTLTPSIEVRILTGHPSTASLIDKRAGKSALLA